MIMQTYDPLAHKRDLRWRDAKNSKSFKFVMRYMKVVSKPPTPHKFSQSP